MFGKSMLLLFTVWLLSSSLVANVLAEELRDEQVAGTVIVDFDQEWTFWASDQNPQVWPIQSWPQTADALSLQPPEVREDTDRIVRIQQDGVYSTGTKWWAGFFAPYSFRNVEQFEAYLPSIKAGQKKRAKHKMPPFSRTEIVYEDGQGGVERAYFIKKFHHALT